MGMDAQTLAVHRIVDPDQKLVETYRVGPDGLLASAERRRSVQLVKVWKEGETSYVPDEEALVVGNRGSTEELQKFRESRFGGRSIRSLVDVPASQGVLSVHSVAPNAFSESEIETIKSVAEVFSLGVARLLDLESLEEQSRELVGVERMRALGEISAGMSHNLNNLLTGILGPTELLKMRIDDEVALGYVDLIHKSASRATELLKRLASVVSDEEVVLEAIRVGDVVEQAVDATMPLWKDSAEAKGVRIDVATEIDYRATIQGTRSGLFDIVVNLLTNAVDAMPEGGAITIQARVGEQVLLTVQDTGTGMDDETLRRVFDPFFTTKMDVGSGLGLSTTRGTINRWGGSIEAASARASTGQARSYSRGGR
jgi:signal transduction histidine kinase